MPNELGFVYIGAWRDTRDRLKYLLVLRLHSDSSLDALDVLQKVLLTISTHIML